jgi:cardiolipin synthase
METFADDWRFACGEALRGGKWWPELTARDGVLARGISSGPDEAIRHLEAVLRTAIAAARHRLRSVTPYFLPDESLMTAIEFAALRGVAVDIVVPERSDVRLVDWAMRAHLAPLASMVSLYFAPQPFSHAKLMTLDGCWCLIGTANWDVRSLRLNFEFNLECCDHAIAADIDRIIDRRIADARRITQRAIAARPLPLRLRDAAARLLLPYL